MKRIHFNPKLAITIALLATVSAVFAFSADQPSESPVELVRRTVQREIAPGNSNARAMFLDHKETPHGSQTKLIVETREGMAGMLIAINDKPLTPEQRHAEEARLSELANNPEALKKKQKSEKEDAERETRIMKALPDAFLYEPDGTTVRNQTIGKVGDQLVRLPNTVHPATWSRCLLECRVTCSLTPTSIASQRSMES
jgi:hypothetical protein